MSQESWYIYLVNYIIVSIHMLSTSVKEDWNFDYTWFRFWFVLITLLLVWNVSSPVSSCVTTQCSTAKVRLITRMDTEIFLTKKIGGKWRKNVTGGSGCVKEIWSLNPSKNLWFKGELCCLSDVSYSIFCLNYFTEVTQVFEQMFSCICFMKCSLHPGYLWCL